MGSILPPKDATNTTMETSINEPATSCSSGPTNSTTKVNRFHPIKIVQIVAEHYAISIAVLLDYDRHKSIVEARTVLCWILRQLNYSYPEIGRIIFRDHTTAMQRVRKAEKWRMEKPKFRELTDSLLSQIQ